MSLFRSLAGTVMPFEGGRREILRQGRFHGRHAEHAGARTRHRHAGIAGALAPTNTPTMA
jgi:hypothetical protein